MCNNLSNKIFLLNAQYWLSWAEVSYGWSLLARNRHSSGYSKARAYCLHMSVGVGVAGIMLLIYFQLCRILNESAIISVSIFNFLFIFLLFPLKGSLFRKVYLLVAGNIVGLAWYLIQSSFGATSVFFLGADATKIITVVVAPIINLIWIVAVWSLGLSVLASANRKNRGDGEG